MERPLTGQVSVTVLADRAIEEEDYCMLLRPLPEGRVEGGSVKQSSAGYQYGKVNEKNPRGKWQARKARGEDV